jgi:hypothetical protein
VHTGPASHDRARELATAAIDFELSAEEWRELDDHLAGCDSCSRFAAATRRDQARLAALPQRPAPPHIHDALRRAESNRRDRTRPLLVLAAAGMAGVLAFATLGGGSKPQVAVSPPIATPQASIAFVSPPASPSASPDGSPSASVEPAPTAPPAFAEDWSPVDDQRSFHDPFGDMEAVAGGERLVAVGDGCGATLPVCHMAIWTSTDGESWKRVPDDPMFEAGPYTTGRRGELTDVVATPDGFVAVGRSRQAGVRRAAVLWSNDGLRWTRAEDAQSLLYGTMEAITATPDGYVAVGNYLVDADASAAAWRSADGLTWRRTSDQGATFVVGGDGTFSDGRVHGGMIDVVWAGDGVVAIGSACAPTGGVCEGITWTSSDGRAWTRERREIRGTPYALLASGGVLVAAGDDGAGHPISWVSDDGGATWSPGRPVSGFLGNFDALVETPAGLVGAIVTGDLTSAVAVSTDGLSWRVVADSRDLGKGVINGMTFDSGRQQVVGVGWDGQTPAAAVWVGR